MVKRTFSLENATPGEVLNYRIEMAIKKYQRHLLDHGSPAIQCAIMSEKIILLMSHVAKYPKDKRAGRFLTELIQKRRNMLNFCMRRDYHRYKWVCVDYGIPDQHPKNSHHKESWDKFYNQIEGL
jgi:small subunit ribosomal protein S15